MAEPAFYRCQTCQRTWQRMEFKMQRNPPPVCLHCAAAAHEQVIDRVREDAYVREVYGPIAEMLFGTNDTD